MKKAKLTDSDLARRRKGDPWKVALAARLRQETTVSLKWIAHELNMGAWTYLNNRLYWHRKKM